MEQISRIGMDTSKHFFQIHGVNAAEKVVLRKKLSTKTHAATDALGNPVRLPFGLGLALPIVFKSMRTIFGYLHKRRNEILSS